MVSQSIQIHSATLTKAGVEYVAGCTYGKVDDNGNLYVIIKARKREESTPILSIN